MKVTNQLKSWNYFNEQIFKSRNYTNPESYDEMTQNQELLQSLKNTAIANEQHENGQSKSAKQVYKELKKELKTKYHDENL